MGIYDNLNTTVPNLISGGNLNNAAYQLGNTIDKTFGNAQGGILDFWKGQQDAIQARNTTMYQNAVKGLTPEQLRQLEEQGINPYTDLPGLMGYGKGVLLDTDKAFESAANAGTALSNANNTWLGQQISNFSPDEQKAIAKTADPYNTMLGKLRGMRPGLTFFDEPGLVTKANEVATQGFNQLADEAAELNKATALNQRLAAGPGGYALEQGLDPKVDNRLRQKLHQEDINQYSKEAATKIKEWQYLNGSEDWTRAIQELGLNPQWINNDVLKEAGIFTTEGQQISRNAATRLDDIGTHLSGNTAKRAQDEADATKAQREQYQTQEGLKAAQRKVDEDNNVRTLQKELEPIIQETLGQGKAGATLDTFNKLQTKVNDYIVSNKIPRARANQVLEEALGPDFTKSLADNDFNAVLDANEGRLRRAFEPKEINGELSDIDVGTLESIKKESFESYKFRLEQAGYPPSLVEKATAAFQQKWDSKLAEARWHNTENHNIALKEASAQFKKNTGKDADLRSIGLSQLQAIKENKVSDPFKLYGLKATPKDRDALLQGIAHATPQAYKPKIQAILGNPDVENYLISIYLNKAGNVKLNKWKDDQDLATEISKQFNATHTNLETLIDAAYAFKNVSDKIEKADTSLIK